MIGLLLAAALAQAEPITGMDGEPLDCEHAQYQGDMNHCAYITFETADKTMNTQWKRAVAMVKAKDAEIDRAYDRQPGWFDTLLAAQRAWLTYRDQSCLLAGFEARGGTMAPMLEAECKARLTDLRTEELLEIADVGEL
jgi:uncharacterized protein YecT (DUF1311 family)